MGYEIVDVTSESELWKYGDPVRPELGVSYKSSPGRKVFGLRDPAGKYVAFCCVARTFDVPYDIMSLSSLTDENGTFYIPYTVWSLKKGSGKAIINALLDHVRNSNENVQRVVTLSPKTEMARKFHLRNGAKEIASHIVTVNFEYII